MLPNLLGAYLTASPPPLPTATTALSSRLPATFLPPRVWPASGLVARRRAGPSEEACAAAASEKDAIEEEWEELEEEFPGRGEDGEEDDYDHDPEIADIMGEYFDDPNKAQSRMEERIRKKRHKIVQAKTGSPNPMKVVFNKFDFSNSYIWFEFYHAILPKDVTLICNALRSWYIVGCLGGCNSMNTQLSQSPLDCQTPSYDTIEGANITPTSFYNIGDFEIQDNLARVWVDIGIHEPLLLDILLNALNTINSDHVGIKQVQFGGLEFENWNENLKTEEAGCSVHKI